MSDETDKKSFGLLTMSWIFFIISVIIYFISSASLNFSLYTQMGVEQKMLITLDQINSGIYSIGFLLASIFFVVVAIYLKKK